jgi:hypothetical protein
MLSISEYDVVVVVVITAKAWSAQSAHVFEVAAAETLSTLPNFVT